MTADTPPGGDGRPKDNPWRLAALGMAVPTTIAASFLVTLAIGYFLDRWLGTGPWLTLVMLMLGVMTAVRETRKLLKRLEEDQKK
ncbi:MAG: AtpZ/AtpI family protein [Candidatus Sumerlaeaceae bacterium]|nr:AtpZ/AtpI family protein [Candidatus Sumerlaeaceae bacterium]